MSLGNKIDTFLKKLDLYRETSSRLSVLDNFSKHFEERRKLFEGFGQNVSSEYKEIAISFEDIVEKFLFVTLVNRRKIDGINALLKFSIDSKNSVALAQGVRALLEHACVLGLIASEVEKFKKGIDGLNQFSKIKNVFNKADGFIYRCYFGRGSKVESDKTKQAIHINDGLELLKYRLLNIDKDYDYLCEFVHPNHGSNLLVSTSDAHKYLNSIDLNFDRDEIVRMIEIGNRILEFLEKCEFFIHSMIGNLGEIGNRFATKGTKLTNVFSVRKPEISGDGKTKETALFVANGRGTFEEIEFIHAYFEKKYYQIYGRVVADISGGFIYDLYDTNKGKLWVRVSSAVK